VKILLDGRERSGIKKKGKKAIKLGTAFTREEYRSKKYELYACF